MSDVTDTSRLEFVLEMIKDIEYIIEENISITRALDNRMGKHALLMCLMQIGESLNKVQDKTLMGTSKNVFCPMRQRSTQPMKWALAFATARVSGKKYKFLEVPL